MLKVVVDAAKKAGNVYLTNITLDGTAFTQVEEEVAEFAILFAKAARMYHETKEVGATGELAYFFKGEKFLNLAANREEDAGGTLEWIYFHVGNDFVFIQVKSPTEKYKIKFSKVDV